MTPRGRGADCMGIGPDVGHWPMRLRAGLRLCREARAAHLIERRNEDGLLGSATGEAETGSAGEQPVKE